MIEIKKHNAGTFCNSIRIAHAPRQPEKAAGLRDARLAAARLLRIGKTTGYRKLEE